MLNDKLLEKLRHLGFPMFQVEDYLDVNETLADVVKSNNVRLWEGFPLLLVNAHKKGEVNLEELRRLVGRAHENSFKQLYLLSVAFYNYLNVKFDWADKFYYSKPSLDRGQVARFLKKLKANQDVVVSGKRLHPQRMVTLFNNYLKEREGDLRELKDERENLSLEQSLSHIFTPKQKELFLKKFNGEKMTKTEKEYFSRAVKKKVLALANSQLHDLARNMLNKF